MKTKNLFLTAVIGLSSVFLHAQISTFSTQKTAEQVTILPYDSTHNFIELGYTDADTIKIYSYIGQTLFVVPKSETSRDMGYFNFYKSANEASENSYGSPTRYRFSTKYEDLVGKYFLVKDVAITKNAYSTTKWLKLENKVDVNDTAWYRLPQRESEFCFLVLSYYEYIKSKYVGNYYAINESFDDEEDNVLAHKCIDIGFDDKSCKLSAKLDDGSTFQVPRHNYGIDYYAEYGPRDVLYKDKLVLVFPKENTTGISHKCLGIGYEVSSMTGSISKPIVVFDNFEYISAYRDMINSDGGPNGFMLKTDYERLLKKYGSTWLNLVVQQRIKVGMPEELVLISWGKPRKKNRDSSGLNQWCYDSDYVYIRNGVVTSWQQF